MRELLTTILLSRRRRVLAALGLALVAGALVLAYKAGQMGLLW